MKCERNAWRELRRALGRQLTYGGGNPAVARNLNSDEAYHMFLSHTWESGQDQMRIVKTQLGSMVPLLNILLDVDNLVETSSPRYIDESQTVLCFFTDGYFDSPS